MRVERSKNALRSIAFGIIPRLYQIIVPFFMRTAIIHLMGVQYLGLNSLFASILQVLNLAELGVGSAMVFSMYKPIAKDDTIMICALEKLYRTYYSAIGLVIAILGIILMPFIPRLISGDIPVEIDIYVLYLLNLGATVLSYWFFSYKNSLFQAHQRTDIMSKISLVMNTVQFVFQLWVLMMFHDYYLYTIVSLIIQVINNIVVAIQANYIYPNYKPRGNLSREAIRDINGRIKDLFTAKLGATIVNSADTVVISAFLGLSVLAMYQNYYFIMSAVMSLIAVIFNSCLAGIGNSLLTESIDKNYLNFRVITFLINWIVTICMSCFATMYQPFIKLWVGDEYIFDISVVALFCIYFYLVIIQQIIGMYKDAAGIWHQDRFRPLIASFVNLVLNLSLVHIWGIHAIIISTIISYILVAMPWIINNVFKYVFRRDWKKYMEDMITYFVVACIISGICFCLCNYTQKLGTIIQVILNALISVTVSNLLLIMIYRKDQYFNQMIDLFDRITRFKISWVLRFLKS